MRRRGPHFPSTPAPSPLLPCATTAKRLIAKAREAGRGFLSGVLPRLVAQHVMHRFPTDVSIRRRMLDIYRLFPHTAPSRAQIYENLSEGQLAKVCVRACRFCGRSVFRCHCSLLLWRHSCGVVHCTSAACLACKLPFILLSLSLSPPPPSTPRSPGRRRCLWRG